MGDCGQLSSPRAGLWLYQLPAGCWENLAQPCGSIASLGTHPPPGPGQLSSYPRDTNNFLTYYSWIFRE